MEASSFGTGYPQTWDAFIGQSRAKEFLQLAAQSARLRRTTADHQLIAGGKGGIGKTALALLFAKELGRGSQIVSGPVKMQDARAILLDMNDGDVFIYDEIHRVMEGGKRNAEWLLHLLADGVMMTPLGPEQMPLVTIVGATTDLGSLPETITGRFKRPPLGDYTPAEGAQISKLTAVRLFADHAVCPSKSNHAGLAAAANNNPRQIGNLLCVLRDMAVTKTIKTGPDGYELAPVLKWLGITADGLDEDAQRYLTVVRSEFKGLAGQSPLMTRLGQPAGMPVVEQLLMTKGFMRLTPQGRMLTPEGMNRAKELQQDAAAA